MQSVSSRIWTRVAVSISCDDNHYITGTAKKEVNGLSRRHPTSKSTLYVLMLRIHRISYTKIETFFFFLFYQTKPIFSNTLIFEDSSFANVKTFPNKKKVGQYEKNQKKNQKPYATWIWMTILSRQGFPIWVYSKKSGNPVFENIHWQLTSAVNSD